MSKLEKLSEEQIQKMHDVKQFWLDYIFSCKNSINREQAKIKIDWLYKFCGLNEPIIIFVDSPMACQYAIVYVKELSKFLKTNPAQVWAQVRDQVWDQVRAQVWAQVRDQVGDQVWDQVWAQVGAQVGDQVRDQVGDQVGDQVRDQVWDQVRAQVGDQVGAQVRDQVGDQKFSYENFSSYGNISNYSWVSFYDFFTQIGVINNKDYNEFKGILSSGIYDMIQLNGFCIVSDMPNKIERNTNNLLHSISGQAISFRDGYGQYYINGRVIPEKYFHSISSKTYKIEDFVNETNEEYKSTCIAFMQEKYGDEYLVDFFRQYLSEIDTFVDKKEDKFLVGTTGGMNVGVYTLFKGKINNEDIAYVRCYCPSTDRMFFLGVDSIHSTAKDAIASLFRIPKKLKTHIKSISRQGERYSTILTEEGKNVLKSMSEAEIADVSGISGNEYFNLIKYEY